MQGFLIRGGRVLAGSVRVGGAKNAALPLLAATVLAGGVFRFRRVPDIRDVRVMAEILRRLGGEVDYHPAEADRDAELVVDTTHLEHTEIPESLMREMRSSIVLLGPLLARFGRARASYPGGCVIGPRPIDLHLRGLRALGAHIEEGGGYIWARADRLRGADIHLDVPSVGATEQLMMAATLARGRTVVRNAAKEPEISDLQQLLRAMGARVHGAGTDTVVIDGVPRLRPADHEVMPDRIEAGTFLLAGAVTQGEVEVEGVVPEHMSPVLAKLREAGAHIEVAQQRVRLRQGGRPTATNVKTQPYPGFPTDLQNPFLTLMCTAEGTSVIAETIWGNRFKVAEELRRMGADIQTEDRIAIVRGVVELTGAEVQATDDLRGGAALVLAGLGARGETRVLGAGCVDRGYERLAERLQGLGAEIERF